MGSALMHSTEQVMQLGKPSAGHIATYAVPDMHCGGCMRKVEQALSSLPGVVSARANLSARRVTVVTCERPRSAEAFLAALQTAGFKATAIATGVAEVTGGRAVAASAERQLLQCLGVAGFAAANVMLLSIAVWSGHAGDMPSSLQTALHWLSAAIALPAIAYAGQPFFSSARAALSLRRVNMDVPISLGVILATSMSLYQTFLGTVQVYFDAAITLLFFLLVGRVLDQRMRVRAASAAENLLGLRSPLSTVRRADGAVDRIATTDVRPGMRVLIAVGERVPVDGRIIAGHSSVDESLITGESVPRPVAIGELVHGGTVNVSAPLELEVTAVAENTLLSDIARLMSTAEQARGRYVRLADRAARFYAPAVHGLGFATFVGWMVAGQGWEPALTSAISVLIITCPCALALAVPAVQIVATSRLFRSGVVVKSPDSLERLADIDTIVFDKTGTLTSGQPCVEGEIDVGDLAVAAALAVSSRHPYSQAIVAAARARGVKIPETIGLTETVGAGVSGLVEGGTVRLGSAGYCGVSDASDAQALYLRCEGGRYRSIQLRDSIRRDAVAVLTGLQRAGYRVEILSGDRQAAADDVAQAVDVATAQGRATPADKIARIKALQANGRRVLMIGDGLNDAPALAAGNASISPASATDVAQTAADVVFQGERLAPITEILAVARRAQRRAWENLAIAIGYNALFVPLAMAGYVTPLIAAAAMSASSIAVTVNALRLARETLKEAS